MAIQRDDLTPFSDIVRGFERTLELGSIAELGRKPSITTMEIIACFADIRGFTKFVEDRNKLADPLVAAFLPSYFSIFPKAVLRELWNLEQNDSFQASIRHQIAPTLVKKLGDGMLLVWEVADMTDEVKLGLQYAVFDVVGYFQEYFYQSLENIRSKRGLAKPKLGLGVGLSTGMAWKLNYGSGQIDYAGRPLNVAARLQGKARPQGIYVDFEQFAPNYLLERKCAGEGDTKRIDIDGIGLVDVWFSEKETLKLRKPRRTAGANPDQLKHLFDADPYEPRPREGTDRTSRLGISEDDIQTLLTFREDKEAEFAFLAAQHVNADGSHYKHLDDLLVQMNSFIEEDENNKFREVGQHFHEAIARLSGSDDEEAEERVALVKSLHYWTTRIYPPAASDRNEMVEEHRRIAEAIKKGLFKEARDEMHNHLTRHHERVREAAFIS